MASLTKVNHRASSIGLLFSLVSPWISLQALKVSLVRLWQVLFATGTAYSSELAFDMEVGNLYLFRSFLFLTMSVSITLLFTNSTSWYWLFFSQLCLKLCPSTSSSQWNLFFSFNGSLIGVVTSEKFDAIFCR